MPIALVSLDNPNECSLQHNPAGAGSDPTLKNDATCSELRKSDDPFLFYSNDDIRIKTLKLKEVSHKAKLADKANAQRKSRISFELHPSLIFEDMLDELRADNSSDVDGFDLEFDEGG
eukprot:CAMPEP_0183742410 /NCGR_PEP_ID=MMETSP0737-20130205/64680_1 /TAXON_ID=385413 /ORGANISM="Thalassiosira miniscula, Strain CCMP1093" /LENGTH=117 /DNA_ID=CAMNT_0025977993 /DNA_START=475 /DNA_END=825 /DNA_ORIENTATION=+